MNYTYGQFQRLLSLLGNPNADSGSLGSVVAPILQGLIQRTSS